MSARSVNNCFAPLNLPARPLRLSPGAGGMLRVFDPLRGKAVALTPEEWVRQHFILHLVEDLGYPKSLMANEVTINLNGLSRRCDTVIWRAGTVSPLMIVEYKAPSVRITQRVFDQIVRYNMVLNAPYLLVTNGLVHYCCRVDVATGNYEFTDGIPPYSSL